VLGALLLGDLAQRGVVEQDVVMPMPYFTAVVSSARYWPKPPSPVTATMGRSGAAVHAPMAAG
jgi:hypothetical protein